MLAQSFVGAFPVGDLTFPSTVVDAFATVATGQLLVASPRFTTLETYCIPLLLLGAVCFRMTIHFLDEFRQTRGKHHYSIGTLLPYPWKFDLPHREMMTVDGVCVCKSIQSKKVGLEAPSKWKFTKTRSPNRVLMVTRGRSQKDTSAICPTSAQWRRGE